MTLPVFCDALQLPQKVAAICGPYEQSFMVVIFPEIKLDFDFGYVIQWSPSRFIRGNQEHLRRLERRPIYQINL
jgi:hypothetical protein